MNLAKITITLRSRIKADLIHPNGPDPSAFKVPIVEQTTVKKAKEIGRTDELLQDRKAGDWLNGKVEALQIKAGLCLTKQKRA